MLAETRETLISIASDAVQLSDLTAGALHTDDVCLLSRVEAGLVFDLDLQVLLTILGETVSGLAFATASTLDAVNMISEDIDDVVRKMDSLRRQVDVLDGRAVVVLSAVVILGRCHCRCSRWFGNVLDRREGE